MTLTNTELQHAHWKQYLSLLVGVDNRHDQSKWGYDL